MKSKHVSNTSYVLCEHLKKLSGFLASLVWTVILANYKEQRKSNKNVELPKFAFEIEFFNPSEPRHLQIQRFPIHYEDSETVLDDGKCVKISLNEVENRFLDANKVSSKNGIS